MLALRRFDAEGVRAYLDAVRPRYLVMRVRTGKVRLVLGFPMWAVEEVAAFGLGALQLLSAAWPHLPEGLKSRLGRLKTLAAAEELENGTTPAVLRIMNELAAGSVRDVLRLGPCTPFVSVVTDDVRIEIISY